MGEAAKAGNIFIPARKAGGKVVEYRCKVCHAHRDFLLHKGVCNTPGKIAFPSAYPAPQEQPVVPVLYLFPACHISGGVLHLRAAAVIVGKMCIRDRCRAVLPCRQKNNRFRFPVCVTCLGVSRQGQRFHGQRFSPQTPAAE